MTNEELERAIDFLLKSQATSEARNEQENMNLRASIAEVNRTLGERIEETNKQIAQTNEQLAQTNEQLAQTNKQLSAFADTQMEFIQVMTRTWEEQGEFNNSMRTAHRKLAQKVDKLIDATGGSGGE